MNDQIIISLSPEMEELQRKETSKKVFTQEGVGLRYPISGVLDSVEVSFQSLSWLSSTI